VAVIITLENLARCVQPSGGNSYGTRVDFTIHRRLVDAMILDEWSATRKLARGLEVDRGVGSELPVTQASSRKVA
jgi:hypothetical protein